MRTVIAGGHGKIALLLTRLLSDSGNEVAGIIRNPDHTADLATLGAEPVVLDLEQADAVQVARRLDGADAVVFAAGAGSGSGTDRKQSVDKGASVLLADAAENAGVRRFLQISSIGIDLAESQDTDPVFAAYLRAKGEAEEDLRSRDLDWTILRPGHLTDEPGTGLVSLDESLPPGKIARADVAKVLYALLGEDVSHTFKQTLELTRGPSPIEVAVASCGR